jgi:hypothetical protein
MSVSMSDMKHGLATFTLRDLNRKPAKVLSACDSEGEVEIRTRAGKKYSLKVLDTPGNEEIVLPDFDKHYQKIEEAGCQPTDNPEEIERLDRIIAGEE